MRCADDSPCVRCKGRANPTPKSQSIQQKKPSKLTERLPFKPVKGESGLAERTQSQFLGLRRSQNSHPTFPSLPLNSKVAKKMGALIHGSADAGKQTLVELAAKL